MMLTALTYCKNLDGLLRFSIENQTANRFVLVPSYHSGKDP